jgi:formate dehydrogenase maturation protein FdhE
MITFIIILLCILSVGSVAAILRIDHLKKSGNGLIRENGEHTCPNCKSLKTVSYVSADGAGGYDRWCACENCKCDWYWNIMVYDINEPYIQEEGEVQ